MNGILWAASCTEEVPATRLSGEHGADLVVIGGGFTGCAAALEAAGQGARVIVLEAETVGHGGSGRNVGLVNAGLWLPPDQVEAKMGAEAGQRLNAALADGPAQVWEMVDRHAIACEATRAGTLHCAHTPKAMSELQARHRQQAARRAPVALLDAPEARGRLGSDRIHGALHDARAGTVQPMGYVRGLARAAAGLGAQIVQGAPVTAMARDGDGWRVDVPGARVRAGALLLATNAYHRPTQGARLPPMTPVNFFQLATVPLSSNAAGSILPGGEGAWDTGLIMTSYRKDAAGRLILGAMGKPDAVGLHRSWAARALARLFPQAAGAGLEYFWSGRIAMTGDKIPKIQRLGPGGYAVFGYSGRGIAPGTVMGRACARALLTGDESGLPLAPVDRHDESWTVLRGLYFEAGARLLHGLGARI
ncbi:FAD-binding oxidoreductase [Lutimaribacter sp. EGI FJ00015]|uniref:FAD-binding oxidoreductase n=1 Tax=Lutimaribacter degradans TaxID=2945989 RepID=A0ACC5ZSH0_9RHOB|nr:FAD-binding oxidoreductase [Lutimaribacter sp. EGI FJ00013]MCM2561090.1 FAD-binding oxidoreductase [Lutimaribacter sp. EGI FJ00013]MCO0611961.1 FAD-binding oxidoreductase [Lutimaribacter sp. EGI FJ00015]MCO0634918.1 FAD-binding oxidoreductase [Lutimaribacter sp. EGI FJ00014]